MEKKLSIISHKKAKSLVEKTAAMIFRGCAIISVLAVVTITGYMIISGNLPSLKKELQVFCFLQRGRQQQPILNMGLLMLY